MDDFISRRAAIDAIDANNGTLYDNPTLVASLHKLLSELPSATDTNVATTDSISRAAVVDAIDGVDWYHQNQHGEMVHGANPDEHQAWYKAEDIYKAIESVPSAQQWIPCSERLPDAECGESDIVLATCGYMNVKDTSVRWIKTLYFNGGNWCYPTGETYEQKVYAWMPRPEPWKGEQNE